MNWGLIASVLGSLATIFGGVRWLLGVYFRQQIKLDAARKVAFAAEAQMLRQEINNLKSEIRYHRAELEVVARKTEEALQQFVGSKETQDKVYDTFREFVLSTKKRFEKIENGNHEKPAEKIEDKKNVGKVIVKK